MGKEVVRQRITTGLFSSRTDDWATPSNLFSELDKEFQFTLDVAASSKNAKCENYFTKKLNGLGQDWKKACKGGAVFCNPRYGKGISNWLQKSFSEAQLGCTVVCLIPFRSDKRYFHEDVLNKAGEISLIKGRLKYNDGKNTAPFPSAIVIYQRGKQNTLWKSYDKEGAELGGDEPLKASYVEKLEQDLLKRIKHDKRSVEKLAGAYGIVDKTEVKELTELAIVNQARKLAHATGSIEQRFHSIVELYNTQVNLSHRTSQSILLQQYSTPAPISYLAGVFCGIDQPTINSLYFEPCAGNGLLTIAGKPEHFIVNEIGEFRHRNLQTQGFLKVTKEDASSSFYSRQYYQKFDAILTNPPFGLYDGEFIYNSFPVYTLEHMMSLIALDCMKPSGRAAVIIGGHTQWDKAGRVQKGKNRIYLNCLYHHFNVLDVININGHKLFSRQGTAFDVRLILIAGRKPVPAGAAPVFNPQHDVEVKSFEQLFERVTTAKEQIIITPEPMKRLELEAEALALELELLKIHSLGELPRTPLLRIEQFKNGDKEYIHYRREAAEWYHVNDVKKWTSKNISKAAFLKAKQKNQTLNAPYQPASQACVVLNTQVPDSMAFETQSAIQKIKQEVGGDIDNFVRHRLNYPTKASLCKVLSAEQIDAVAMAIYNIEARQQGMVIGDQTGIGKGRVAAAMIRYGVVQGHKPVFLTEKANLFSDIYRDLKAVGSGHLKPFIVNGKESKTEIKDEDGNVVYEAPTPSEQQSIFEEREVPAWFDFVVGTYSQFNSPEKKPVKPAFLTAISHGNIFILDEAHNSSGSSNTGEYLQGVVANTKGVVFLSATFAKRPDNMPIYAMKTAIADCNMTRDDLVQAINHGGVALQEVLSAQLVSEGQMLRRERSFEGVEVNYVNLEDKVQEHKAVADNITSILRDIISFQSKHIDKEVKELDKAAVAESKAVEIREGTNKAGVDNLPYFSKIFQVINQMLFSIKAAAVAEKTIARLKEGKKPVIAFSSTMGSFIETMENEKGLPTSEGDIINTDFTEVLRRGLEGILRYTEKDINGESIFKKFELETLSPSAQADYHVILTKIQAAATGITISPIDIIIKIIQDAGYSVAEVTGRKYELQINPKTNKGLILSRKRINTNDAFRQFNNNEVDVLMINQSGSTGASAHAIPTAKVPKEEVRQRVMIVLQAELDISTEVQKRGRINRTGQILKPIYDYVTSAIPAEKRLMMMLQKKLKSLDANTTSNQKQSTKILDVPDFLNKYGDKIVKEYLVDNPEINKLLDDPLDLISSREESSARGSSLEDAAMRVSGRVAVLSTKMQEDFYSEIAERYSDYIDYLKQIGEYDLEVEAMNLEAETLSSRVLKMGKGGESAFGNDSVLETVKANVLKKPFSKVELENIIQESLKGKDAKQLQQEFIDDYIIEVQQKLEDLKRETNEKYDELIKSVPNEKRIQKLTEGADEWIDAVAERRKELNEARDLQLRNTEKAFNNRRQYIEKFLRFFYVGRFLNYPMETFSEGEELVPAVFVGFLIDMKKKNPYAASAIKLRFAIANSSKYLAIPASYSEEVMAVIGASNDLPQPELPQLLSDWETHIKDTSVDRKTRHIITGNLLQAFSDQKGKLVSYTTMDKSVKKGILLPENWNPGEEVQDKVVVPIIKALPLIKSIVQNGHIVTNNGISFFRYGHDYKVIVAASRSKGGDIYLDKRILELVNNYNFEKTADKMVAVVPLHHIEKLVAVLQEYHSVSITVSSHHLKDLSKETVSYSTRKKIELPPPEESGAKMISMLELEAEALALELELLAA
jgi:phage N-6-adenine-methyltransferase